MKQDCIALSSREVEHIAMCESTKKILWLRELIHGLSEISDSLTPLALKKDNQGAMKWAGGWVQNTKHVSICRNFVKHATEKGEIRIQFCPNNSMVADVLTKPLLILKFEQHRTSMGVVPLADSKKKSVCLLLSYSA